MLYVGACGGHVVYLIVQSDLRSRGTNALSVSVQCFATTDLVYKIGACETAVFFIARVVYCG